MWAEERLGEIAQVGQTRVRAGRQAGEVGVFGVEFLEFHEGKEGVPLQSLLPLSGLQEAEQVELCIPPCEPFEPPLAGLEILVLSPQLCIGLNLLASQFHVPLLLLLDPLDESFLELCICYFAAGSPPSLAALFPSAEIVGCNAVLLGNVGNRGHSYLLHQKLFSLLAEDSVAIEVLPRQLETGLLASQALLDLSRKVP